MLPQKTINKIAGLAKIDETVLADAINAETETDIEIPEGVVAFTPDDLQTYTGNAIEKAKPGIRTAAIEQATKEQIIAHGLELPDSAKKDFPTVFDAFEKKTLADANLDPNKTIANLKRKLQLKDELLTQKDQVIQTEKETFANFKFTSTVDQRALSLFSNEGTLPKEDRLILFNSKFTTKKGDDGGLVVTDILTGKVIEDEKLNPKPFDDIAKEFDSKYVAKPGAGGRGGSGGPTPTIDKNKIKETVISEGLKENTVEYWKRYNELLNK